MSFTIVTGSDLDTYVGEVIDAIEAWPCADCEMAAGVASEIGIIPEIVRDADTIRIVDGDEVALCEEHDQLHADAEIEALAVALGLLDPMAVTR
jgi:hypothetical protein